MRNVVVIDLGLAKNVFQVHGVHGDGAAEGVAAIATVDP